MTAIRDLSRRLAFLDLGERKSALLARAATRLAEAARRHAGDATPIESASDATHARVTARGAAARGREFGTSLSRPRPFLAPAAAELGPEMADEIAHEIAAEIARAIAELS